MTQHTPDSASRLERLFANFIDTFLLMIPAGILLQAGGPESALALVGTFACNMAYFVAFTASNWQATPGKRLFGIHVRRLDGRAMTQRDAVERFLAYIMPSLPMYLTVIPQNTVGILTVWLTLAWYMPILVRPDRRGLHDLLCATHVVNGRL